MSFWEIIETTLLKPLQLVFEVIYMMAYSIIGNPGVAIILLSLVINFLILPLYKRADAMQEEERNMEQRLEKRVAQIKKAFRGEERMMILQTYYRQNGYKPTYVLRSAISLFLQIPFFIAAYQFLSHLQLLNGVSFGPIRDLAQPDNMFTIAGVIINILPIIMTLVNLITCVLFTKGGTFKSKVQLYAMAVFFLVFLYNSPSGLVFYWTLNNVFSMLKAMINKCKNPGKIVRGIFSVAGIGLAVYGLFFYDLATIKRTTFLVGTGIIFQIPLIYALIKNRVNIEMDIEKGKGNKKIFFAGGLFLAVLIGVLIPSSVIKASPQEFVDVNYFYYPIWFIVNSFCLAFGAFVIWAGVFYWLAKPTVKAAFDKAIWLFSGIAVVSYMFFGKNLGLLTPELKYEEGMDFTLISQMLNFAALLIVAVALYFLAKCFAKRVFSLLMVVTIAMGGMSIMNIVSIDRSIAGIQELAVANGEKKPSFSLSKKGKNVIVLMFDRAMAEYVPYFFNEKPELKEKFSGFTNYTNVVSFGKHTNFGLPAVFGGYEYTPYEMNKRKDEPLVKKHNEALKVMPVLFDQNGYDVTVCDPSYANYEVTPDLAIYDEYPDIKAYNTKGKFSSVESKQRLIDNNKRNFFFYGLMKTVPLSLQEILYNQGNYYRSNFSTEDDEIYSGQTITESHVSTGLTPAFMECYNVLDNLPNMTEIKQDKKDNFLMMTNNTTHEMMLLQEPEYVPAQKVDNREFEKNNQDRFTLNGHTLSMEKDLQITHYQINMATMLQMAEWFDYMRENDVYDNTRIILVADHGYGFEHSDKLIFSDGEDLAFFHPLLMVKDFNSSGFEHSEEFMTNGDVPTIASKDLIEDPINPFTGSEISADEKTAHDQYIIGSYEWDVSINNGNMFLPSKWYSVHDNMWNKKNWKVVAEDEVLPGEE